MCHTVNMKRGNEMKKVSQETPVWGSALPSEKSLDRPLNTGRRQLLRLAARALVRQNRDAYFNPLEIEDLVDDICKNSNNGALLLAADKCFGTLKKQKAFARDLQREVLRLT